MSLELLPNEVLLYIFSYLDGTDIFNSFNGLNFRFNSLIYNQFSYYQFNFRLLSRYHFDTICQQHLPLIADRVISLSFMDNCYTIDMISLFYTYTLSFKTFISLQYLSLFNINSCEILMTILDELQNLDNLTRLTLNGDIVQNMKSDYQNIVNSIWNLPKLTHCNYQIHINGQTLFCIPTKISLSLECVLINVSFFKWNQIEGLFQCTPHLTCLSITINTFDYDNYRLCLFPMLADFTITVYHDFDVPRIFDFLKNSPNLFRLTVILSNILIDGHQWEQIIRSYLPKLKIFRLNMKAISVSKNNIQENIDRLIGSFQGSFWIHEHQWFFRCFFDGNSINFNSLCETTHSFVIENIKTYRLTCPFINPQLEFFNRIECLVCTEFFDHSIPSNFNLSNIKTLAVKLPGNQQLWTHISTLRQLKTLMVSSHIDTYQHQLQMLLDQAPFLNVLQFSQDMSLPIQKSLFIYKNITVDRLYLQNEHPYFNEEECMTLAHSPLGRQCKLLAIRLNKPESIICLVTNMRNLQSLTVDYIMNQNCTHLSNSLSCTECSYKNGLEMDTLIRWLKHHLPSTCSITTVSWFPRRLRLWI